MPQSRKILVFSANPPATDWLKLDRELVSIWQRLQQTQGFTTTTVIGATVDKIRQALLSDPPELLHFAGHGEHGWLVLEDDNPGARGLNAAMLKPLLEPGLRCVLLNACDTVSLGEALRSHAEWIIAMQGPISDTGARDFTRAFYDALVHGKSYPRSFEIARAALIHNVQDQDESETPVLIQGEIDAPSKSSQPALVQQETEISIRDWLFERLTNMLSGQFDEVTFKYALPPSALSKEVTQLTHAKQLIQIALEQEADPNMPRLRAIVERVSGRVYPH